MAQLLVIPGDGIGPEIIAATLPMVEAVFKAADKDYSIKHAQLGGQAVDDTGSPYPEATQKAAKAADAILFGAIGGPQWEKLPREKRPETGLLAIREDLELFANFRPAMMFDELVQASSLKPEIVKGLDILIVRELTGGIYFGQPRGIKANDDSTKPGFKTVGFNTMVYTDSEIRRLAKVAFQAAMRRSKKLCSVDKANVLEVSQLWRDILTEEAVNWPDVELSHMYVDNAAMQLVKDPRQFDVVVTGNLFGDILSDAAAMLTGSIGMLPSASLDVNNKGLYEPCHGSAPDIAGQDKANPLATILSAAMMLRYTFGMNDYAQYMEAAVHKVLKQGYRTIDLMAASEQSFGLKRVGTKAMGMAVLEELNGILDANTTST